MVTVSGGDVTVWNAVRGDGTVSDVSVSLPTSIYSAATDPDGELLAVTTGLLHEEGIDGVLGQVVVINLNDLSTVVTTDFTGAYLTHVAFSPNAKTVSFVKDLTELWILDLTTGQQTKIADSQSLTPNPGSMIIDPAFSSSGLYVYFGLKEKGFEGGEDDKLDNVWKVSLAGIATRLSSHVEGPNAEDWLVIRRPVPRADDSVAYTISESGAIDGSEPEETWVALLREQGVEPLGPVPNSTVALSSNWTDTIAFAHYDEQSDKLDVYVMPLPENGTWTTWCETGCEVIHEDVDYVSVPQMPSV
jgi:hypothetical protein